MAQNKKVANSLAAASAAAVMAVYAAGYARTRSAAAQMDAQSQERRPVAAEQRTLAPAIAEVQADSSAITPAVSSAANRAVGEDAPALTASLGRSPAVVTAPVAPVAPPSVSTSATSANPSPVTATLPAPSSSAPLPPAPAPAVPPAPPAVSVVPAPAVPETTPKPAPALAAAPAPSPAPKWKDGTYSGWGTCRHGDIQATVVIEAGRITAARISQCLTRYSCDVIGRLPPEVLERQSPEVDYVSGATQSANAFYYALVDALGKAK